MENAEEILQCLDEFSKVKPKDIPRELEEYLCFVAKTGDPVYQWPLIKCLFREKLINVITEFYEQCPSVEIPPCPNVETFNYDNMKTFILEKLDTFSAAPFTVQRICELLTAPRKEYNRIDKYMRALEKNILVVSTREPGNRRNTENGESVVNGLESEHVTQDIINSDINVEVEMDETSVWPKNTYVQEQPNLIDESQKVQDTFISESKPEATCSSSIDSVITSRPLNYMYPQTTETITGTDTPAESTVPSNQPDNITVTIANVTEEEIDQLTEEEEPQQETEQPIYVSPLTTKDTSIYIGTNENGDQLYRIKYEPYVEIDYMAIPETAFPSEPETVYEGEVKPDSESQTETVQESVSESTESEKPNWEVTNSSETIITSSDEISTATETVKTVTEEQVTESNIESDTTVPETEIKEPVEEPESIVENSEPENVVENEPQTVEPTDQPELLEQPETTESTASTEILDKVETKPDTPEIKLEVPVETTEKTEEIVEKMEIDEPQNVVSENIEENTQETVQESMEDTAQETVPENIEETVPENIPETIQPSIQDNVQEVVEESMITEALN